MSRNKWVAKEPSQYIVSENYTRQQKIHSRLRKMSAAINKEAEAWRKSFRQALDNPPLLIRMKDNTEGIPVGMPIELPHEYSTALMRVRAATPVGDFRTVPSLVIGEDEL